MIVEYDDSGRIFHIVRDPVPRHMAGFLRGEGKTFLEVAPVPWPEEPTEDADGNWSMQSNGWDPVPCDLMRDYVVDGELAPRPGCPATVAVDWRTVRIANVPSGARVTVVLDDVSIEVDDTEIEFDEPGAVRILIAPPWPYMEAVHDLEIK